ncbi:hypothetical protein [Actinomadura rayongensis]|uniref:Uncharacterized protein n=1 Tax=Actinomadura rayongensis TaxID=1429076 RepID=A0A6I4W7Y9_9ACTN|nr:hypothetical protein [Actinomadura rayongensis]MXQ64870.1 hypothetical protein [Actinomadura rayongensis]
MGSRPLAVASLAAGLTALTACGGSPRHGPAADPVTLAPSATATVSGQPTGGTSGPPTVGPSPRAWTTPRVNTGSGASLSDRTPDAQCRVIWSPYPVRIEGFTAAQSGAPAPITDSLISDDVLARSRFGTVTYETAPSCTGSVGEGVQAHEPCAPGTVIGPTDGCAVTPAYTDRPEIPRPAHYTVLTTWRLSKLCTDASAPCSGLGATADRPVRATWGTTRMLSACATWQSLPEAPNGGESSLGQCQE